MHLDSADFIAFDLETTGLHAVRHRIVEIGAVRFRADGSVVDTFTQLVQPGEPIPADVQDIHGISDDMVADAPTIDAVLPEFFRFLGPRNRILLAHNASFDTGFLAAAVQQTGLSAPDHSIIDTCRLARQRMRLDSYRLESIGRHLNLIERSSHRALNDAVLLKDVFCHLIRTAPPLTTFSQLTAAAPPISVKSFSADPPPLPEHLRCLHQAIARGIPVAIVYSGGSRPGRLRHVTPRSLVSNQGHCYLLAECHQDHVEKTYRIDRIRSVQICEQTDAPPETG